MKKVFIIMFGCIGSFSFAPSVLAKYKVASCDHVKDGRNKHNAKQDGSFRVCKKTEGGVCVWEKNSKPPYNQNNCDTCSQNTTGVPTCSSDYKLATGFVG